MLEYFIFFSLVFVTGEDDVCLFVFELLCREKVIDLLTNCQNQ